MAEVNVNSADWKTILTFIEDEKNDAILRLIADEKSEQQRGVLRVLERLEQLAEPGFEFIKTDEYI